MVIALSAAAAAFIFTLLLGYPYLGLLRRAGVTKLVRADELGSHFGKSGTPTMGGLLFTFTIAVLTAAYSLTLYRANGHSILLPLEVLVAASILGGYDDRLSLTGSRGGGLSGRVKFAILAVVALAAA